MAVRKQELYLSGQLLPNILALAAVIGFPLCVWLIIGLKTDPQTTWYKPMCQTIGAIWAVGPPTWFIYEYSYHFPKHGNPDAGFTQLKTSQDLASKVWAAFVVVLAALFTGVYPK
jgi:hypothetical protein